MWLRTRWYEGITRVRRVEGVRQTTSGRVVQQGACASAVIT